MKFRYSENVEIIAGFYRGQKGKIRKARRCLFALQPRYSVNSDKIDHMVYIKESHLRSIDYPNVDFNKKLQKLVK